MTTASERKQLRAEVRLQLRRHDEFIAELEQEHAVRTERIARRNSRMQELAARNARDEVACVQLVELRRRVESMREGLRTASEAAGLPIPTRTRHSSRGRVGIRSLILERIAEADNGASPAEVRRRLAEVGVAARPKHVSGTMARMARDGELERLGYGLYRLPQGSE